MRFSVRSGDCFLESFTTQSGLPGISGLDSPLGGHSESNARSSFAQFTSVPKEWCYGPTITIRSNFVLTRAVQYSGRLRIGSLSSRVPRVFFAIFVSNAFPNFPLAFPQWHGRTLKKFRISACQSQAREKEALGLCCQVTVVEAPALHVTLREPGMGQGCALGGRRG